LVIRPGVVYCRGQAVEDGTVQLVDLIVLACSLANPAACREYHMLLQSTESLQTCTMRAQPYLARWNDEHPDLRIARWHCAWPDQEDEKT
jgi:hypothetical protein